MTSLHRYRGVPLTLAATIAISAVLALSVSSVPRASAISNGRLAFQSTVSGDEDQIFTMNPDGSGREQITHSTYNNEMGSWSPEGKKLAIDRNLSDTHDYVIIVMNADGTGEQQLTNTGGDYNPTWSPDGTKIAFTSDREGNRDIFVMNANGTNPVNVTNSPGWDSDPAWSPDGTRIAFRSERDSNAEIYVMEADGGNQTRLTNNAVFDAQPQWSPDSSRIVFWRGAPNTDTFAIDADGGNEQQLTFGGTGGDAGYSPDGSLIVFESAGGLFTMAPDGSDITIIPNTTSKDSHPAWQPLTLHAGDTDCDGQVKVKDALPPLLTLAGTPGDAGCVAAGNVKCDDALTLDDVLLILRHADELAADLPQSCPGFGAEIT